QRDSAMGMGDSEEKLIHPGDPQASLLIARVADPDAGDLMPLDGEPLSEREISVLRNWITAGAVWPDSLAVASHWAYQPIVKPALPEVSQSGWVSTPVDAFVLKRLEEEGLAPAREMLPELWLRRVSLALTGLPPSVEDLQTYLDDTSPVAAERAVDRLLSSPRFGEKWAVSWLDLARYADSNGFQADQLRDSWAYRDWVINAFNRDLPFDQFVIEQLAGDLLPNATIEQKIATGFHRTVTCNVEAGVHPEENRVNQVFDRVNTTGIVFLGTSLECAQCHEHKYDPFAMKDYYQLFAYFNNTPLEVKQTAGVTWDFYGPAMELPLEPEQQQKREALQKELAQLEKTQEQMTAQSAEQYAAWLEQIKSTQVEGETGWEPLVVEQFVSSGKEISKMQPDQSVLLTGPVPDKTTYTLTLRSSDQPLQAIQVEALTHPDIPGAGPGRGDPVRSNFILSEIHCYHVRADGSRTELALGAPVADYSQPKWDVANAIDGDLSTGWAIGQEFGKPHWARFQLLEPLQLTAEDRLEVQLDQNYGRGRTIGCVRILGYHGNATLLDLPAEILELAHLKKRDKKEEEKLQGFFEEQNPDLIKLKSMVKSTERQLKELAPPTTLVMVEMDEPRETFILNRGNYLTPGEKVQPGIPDRFVRPGHNYPPNRLGLAQWLVSEDDPLLPRVTVNRWWAELFGQGLVTTIEDFGSQGELPTHPELLDWLAAELRENGWSMKDLLKKIVLSSTFRMDSAVTPELYEKDPQNRLYARGPRFRLTAEMVRDNALAISGLLSQTMGGAPIMPYQPEGIWRSIGRNQPKWITAQDDDRFRRGVYVIWKRDAPYTSLVSFDAPDRTACVVNRPRTNTPLQALTLLNDPAYAEMSLALADRILLESQDSTDRERIITGFRMAVCREPSTVEVDLVTELLEQERVKIRNSPALAAQRLASALEGFPQPDSQLTDEERAAWFAVSSVLLNLDETICQQ
ncbi:MAG: DUF1553 domain-containing protein, partial [Planctomycetaceae bacterium]|nr:DUF1553 domain-containing protein [Planctomycetaceae bacterium]